MSRFKVSLILAWILVLSAVATIINAEVPHLINYQGCLTDDAGQPVEDGEYQMQFRIHNDSTAYSPVWTSQPETILVINGIFNFQLGSTENIPAWQLDIGESGEYDGIVNTDMVETDPGGATTINFESPFTSVERPHFYITVMLKQAANGLVEGTAIKAVEDIKGASGNWTGFDITVSKYSDGSSISDATEVYVTWMAVSR